MTHREPEKRTAEHALIMQLISKGSEVLDLGCGCGNLLLALTREKGVRGCGVEIDEECVIECLRRGLSVIQSNLDEGLKEYPDQSYDYVILNQTLQSVYNTELILKEMLRVGRKAIVGIPNFAYWRIRSMLAICGTLPLTEVFRFEWYNTPNIRLVTVKDFEAMCRRIGLRIVNSYFLAGKRTLSFPYRLFPNFFCENGLFVLEKVG